MQFLCELPCQHRLTYQPDCRAFVGASTFNRECFAFMISSLEPSLKSWAECAKVDANPKQGDDLEQERLVSTFGTVAQCVKRGRKLTTA